MPIIPNRTLRHNKFQYLNIGKRKHDFLELTYPGLPKWLWEIPPERIHGRYIPFHELYYTSYDSEATEEERNKALLEFVRSKYIRANAEENLSVKEIIEKYKRLAAKREYSKKKRGAVVDEGDEGDGGDDDEDHKGVVAGGVHVEKPRFIAHAHSEDPSGVMFMEEGDGDPSTGLGSVGPALGPEIGSVLGAHGGQPTDTANDMLHADVKDSSLEAQLASLLTAMQNSADMDFEEQALQRFDLLHDDPYD